MKFDPFSKKIEAVLGGNNSYIIPNFQRDYSWDKKIMKILSMTSFQ